MVRRPQVPARPRSSLDSLAPIGDRARRRRVSVACADRLSKRLRSSVSKPFMTDSTVINASTPSATPSSDTQVMKETKKLCSRASEYRRPTKTGTGWNIRGD